MVVRKKHAFDMLFVVMVLVVIQGTSHSVPYVCLTRRLNRAEPGSSQNGAWEQAPQCQRRRRPKLLIEQKSGKPIGGGGTGVGGNKKQYTYHSFLFLPFFFLPPFFSFFRLLFFFFRVCSAKARLSEGLLPPCVPSTNCPSTQL